MDLGHGGEVEPEHRVADQQQVGVADSSRASTARCTLPPDRLRMARSPGVFTP
jgi:hypothetical protein